LMAGPWYAESACSRKLSAAADTDPVEGRDLDPVSRRRRHFRMETGPGAGGGAPEDSGAGLADHRAGGVQLIDLQQHALGGHPGQVVDVAFDDLTAWGRSDLEVDAEVSLQA